MRLEGAPVGAPFFCAGRKTRPLLRCLLERTGRFRVLGLGLERRGAEPGVAGDVEHDLVGSVEFRLVEPLLAFGTPREAGRAELLEVLYRAVDVLDQHAEVMDAAEVEAVALVPAEMQDREADRSVT